MVENLEGAEIYKDKNKKFPKSYQLEKIIVCCYISF